MIYLDNSATTYPKPNEVYEFMNQFYRTRGVNPGRSGSDAALEAGEMMSDTRKMLTQLFNGGDDYNRLTFSYNATDSLNMIIQGLAEKGSHVITTMLEHNSVLRPLYHLEQQGIISVTYLPFDDRGYVNPDDVKKAILPNTKMMVCTHCSNVIGTIQPIAQIGKICKENGLIFVVDGSQGAGANAMDMINFGVDAYIFTGHKCLMGPTGIGGSYVRPGIEVKHTRYGGTGVKSAQESHLDEYPYRLEAGTQNLVGIAGLNAGVKWITQQGIDNLHKQEMTLWKKLRDGIKDIDGVTVYCATAVENQNPVLSFNIKGMDPLDVGTMMDVDYDIVCRTGLQCAPKLHERIGTLPLRGTVRLSIGPFNTDADIDTAIEAVTDIASMRN
ncbi:MAG: aminotransferase class V-fold PLP-dependent enzyme [Bacteroidales bacterium]|jgi:cysteine desulfurase family protein|nr:aminotransferase class V-fold PLP-dependent enzyme [Bacteroidales bacterium]